MKTENENASRQIEQFEEKILSLERELLAKQQENERMAGQLKGNETIIQQLKENIRILEEKQKQQAVPEPVKNESQVQTDGPSASPASEEKPA